MNSLPIAVANTKAMTDSASGNSLSASSDDSQASEFTNLLSDSISQHGTTPDSPQTDSELTAQQQLQIALRSKGQELPLTGEMLPVDQLADTDMGLLAGLSAELPAQTDVIVDELLAGTQLNSAVSSAVVTTAALQGLAVVDQESTIAAQALSQRSPVSMFNNQPVTQMQQTSIPMQSGTGEQALNGQSEAGSLPVLTEARMATTENGPDFSRIIEKGLAQLNREMVSSTHAPISEPTSRTALDGMKLSSENLLLQQPIDKPKWGQEFGSRMVWMSKEGIQNAQLRLTPAHLGTIEVKISIQNDQANVSFMSQHGAVREVIEATLPRLREMMQEAGVKLEQANVSGGESNTDTQQKHADKMPAQFAQGEHTSENADEEMDGSAIMQVEHEGMLYAVDYYA